MSRSPGFVLLLLLCATLSATQIAENGRARAVIVAGDHQAAAELITYLGRVTGADLATGAPGGDRILVGGSVCAPEIRQLIEQMGRDGYLIKTQSDGALCLAGSGSDGTAFAVYRFLEEFAGVRWLWPGELGEVVPRRPTLGIGRVSIREEPAFVWRDLGPGGALWGPLDKLAAERKLGVSEEHQKTQKLWERRNRFGGERIYGGHAFGEILPPAKLGPIHPEYFALVDGKRDWQYFNGKHRSQPCTSNPDVIRLTTEYARDFFGRHPEYDAFSISLNDGRGFCECDNCRRLDSGQTQVEAADPETGRTARLPVITDRIVAFANQVAEGLAKTHPNKKLILFAYGMYKEPPQRVKVHPNRQYPLFVAAR